MTLWTLDCLRVVRGVDLRRLVLSRAAEGRLEIDLRVAAGIPDLVLFYERFLSDSYRIAPRELLMSRFQRLEPETWDPDLAKFRSPPVELHLRAVLWRPGKESPKGRLEVGG